MCFCINIAYRREEEEVDEEAKWLYMCVYVYVISVEQVVTSSVRHWGPGAPNASLALYQQYSIGLIKSIYLGENRRQELN